VNKSNVRRLNRSFHFYKYIPLECFLEDITRINRSIRHGKVVLRIFVLDIFFAKGFPLGEASEPRFISLKVSLLVLLFSIFSSSTCISHNIWVSSL
jgi:hypothetical protein